VTAVKGDNMNRKTILMMTVSLVLMLCIFVGCDSYNDNLTGTWKCLFEETQDTITMSFDGDGNFTVSYSYGTTEDGTYRTDNGYIQFAYFTAESEEGVKLYVKRTGEGTTESPYLYTFRGMSSDEGKPGPDDFNDYGHTCANGEFKELIENKNFPLLLTYRRKKEDDGHRDEFDTFTIYSDIFFDALNQNYYDDDELLYTYEYSARGNITFNPDSWDWENHGDCVISSDYVYIFGEFDNLTFKEISKYVIDGNKLLLWWDIQEEPFVFIRQ